VPLDQLGDLIGQILGNLLGRTAGSGADGPQAAPSLRALYGGTP
jgi:hypothetical protein